MWTKLKKAMYVFHEMSPAAKASIALMMSQLIQKGLALLTSPIYTRLLTTDEYGEVSLFFSWYEILVIFTGLCLSKGVFNNGMMDFRKNRDEFALSMYSLTFLSSVLIGITATLFCRYIYNFMDLPFCLIIYLFVLLAFESALSLWTVRQRFEYRYNATSIVTIFVAVISPICGILGIIYFPDNKVLARILGARNIFLIAYIAILIHLILKAKGRIKTLYWKYALKFNIPLIPHYLSLHILNHMDRIMISSLIGTSAAGIYSVAYNGSAIVKMIWQSINASLIPWTYEKCEKKKYKELNNLTKILVACYAMICMVFMLLAPEVMMILAPSSYESGIYVIPSVTAGVFFSSLYYIFANVVYYYKKPKYVMYSSCLSAVLNMVLNYIFIPKFGFIAAGYTTLVCYLIQSVIDYFAMRLAIKEKIYDIKFFVTVSAGILAMTMILDFVYEYYIIRYCMLVIVLAVTAKYVYFSYKFIIGRK